MNICMHESVCVHAYTVPYHAWSGDDLQEAVLSFHYLYLGTDLRLSGPVTSAIEPPKEADGIERGREV